MHVNGVLPKNDCQMKIYNAVFWKCLIHHVCFTKGEGAHQGHHGGHLLQQPPLHHHLRRCSTADVESEGDDHRCCRPILGESSGGPPQASLHRHPKDHPDPAPHGADRQAQGADPFGPVNMFNFFNIFNSQSNSCRKY